MANDPFDELLELEDEYYNEGYEAGVSDSRYAGMIEGRTFGIEKGYEKAIELGKAHGRAILWQARLNRSISTNHTKSPDGSSESSAKIQNEATILSGILQNLSKMHTNTRLQKHIDTLLSTSEPNGIIKDNSDEAVSEFDDRLAKAHAKLKVITNIVGESVNPTSTGNSGIEDATGLNARS